MTIVESVSCADHPQTRFGLNLSTGRVYLTGWTAVRLRREVAAVRLGGTPCRCTAAVVAWRDGDVARLPDTLGAHRQRTKISTARLVRRLAARRPAPPPSVVLEHDGSSVGAAVADQLAARGLAVRRVGANLSVAADGPEILIAVDAVDDSTGFAVSVTPVDRTRPPQSVRYTPAFCRALPPAGRAAVVLDLVEAVVREGAAVAAAAVADRRAFRRAQAWVTAGTDSPGAAIDCDRAPGGLSLTFRTTRPLSPAVARYAAKRLAALGDLLAAYHRRPRG